MDDMCNPGPSTLQKLKACHFVCAQMAERYRIPAKSPGDDFARGSSDQIFSCLYVLQRELSDLYKTGAPGLTEDTDMVVTAIARQTVKDLSPEDVLELPATHQKLPERVWHNVLAKVDSGRECSLGFEDFDEYERGTAQGSKKFLEVLLPDILARYKDLAPLMQARTDFAYKM